MEEETRNPVDVTVARGDDIAPGEGEPTNGGSDVAQEGAPAPKTSGLTLEQINEMTGRNYQTLEDAQKGVQETYKFVGKRKEELANSDDGEFVSKEQYNRDMFYNRHQEYNTPEVKEVIDSIAKAKGIPIEEVVETDNFKNVFSKIKGYDETQSAKSVLRTNPRITESKDSLSKAAEAAKDGNQDAAKQHAVDAVKNAYGMQ